MKASVSNLMAAIAGSGFLPGAAEARHFAPRSEEEQSRAAFAAAAAERVLLDSSLSMQGALYASGSAASAKSGKMQSGKGKSYKGASKSYKGASKSHKGASKSYKGASKSYKGASKSDKGVHERASCPDVLDQSRVIDDRATLYYAVVQPFSYLTSNGLFCGRLVVTDHDGLVQFGVSPDGGLDGSNVIYGIPEQNIVEKSNIILDSNDELVDVEAPPETQTLMDTSIGVDEDGSTIMEFTKILVELDELPYVVNENNWFLHQRDGVSLSFEMFLATSGPGPSGWSGRSSSSKSGKRITQRARMGAYPGYAGELEVSGSVEVEYVGNEGALQYMLLSFDLEGLEGDCSDCGIHIHRGVSCADPALPQGHGFNSAAVNDHWTTAGGAVYDADASGRASGSFYITNGYDADVNFHHAVVIHGQAGQRVGCGILM